MTSKYSLPEIVILMAILWLQGCITAPDFSDVPTLYYEGISKSTMVQASLGNDTLLLFLRFTDGDGDVGQGTGTFGPNIQVRDNRTGDIYANFLTPEIPAAGANNGIDVDLSIVLTNDCCIYEPITNLPPCDVENIDSGTTNSLQLTITIKDRAGNVSNEVVTDPITLICRR